MSDEPETNDSAGPGRLDAEWLALNALREAIGVGQRSTGGKDATYSEVLDFAGDVAPQLFDRVSSLLMRAHEPPLVREYRERAHAESAMQRKKITPINLLDREIARLERLTEVRDSRLLLARLSKLLRTRDLFEERPFSEHKLLFRDALTAARPELPVPPVHRTDYTEYPLQFKQAIRIRILHPDRPEHATGADLLYEFCDQKRRQARLAFVQYKIWDGRSLRFSSSGNLEAQMQKLQAIACKSELCSAPAEPNDAVPDMYRLPHCAAFLRPTDRLQSADASMISSGVHVPICVAASVPVEKNGGRALRKDPVRSRSVSQHAFEELFGRAMLGSKWLPYLEVEGLYRDSGIFDSSQRIVVHAQQYDDIAA